jgi:hypothetical protein
MQLLYAKRRILYSKKLAEKGCSIRKIEPLIPMYIGTNYILLTAKKIFATEITEYTEEEHKKNHE